MGLIDRLRYAGERGSVGVRETTTQARIRRDLSSAYRELGRQAFTLAEHGVLRDRRLAKPLARVRAIEQELAARSSATSGTGQPDSRPHPYR